MSGAHDLQQVDDMLQIGVLQMLMTVRVIKLPCTGRVSNDCHSGCSDAVFCCRYQAQ